MVVIITSCTAALYLVNNPDTSISEAIGDTLDASINSSQNEDDKTYNPDTSEYDDTKINEDEDSNEMTQPYNEPFVPATEMDLDPSSITFFVNKEFDMPKNYVPDDLVIPNVIFDTPAYEERKLLRKEAASALEALFSASLEDNLELVAVSGYRSYARQHKIFTSNIFLKGKSHTLRYSAVPGTSEHQTGLAIDVSSKELRNRLITRFSSTKEGIWLAENSHKFGFIIRYPEDKTELTGYAYEPWHIRYVGIPLANYLFTEKMILEEYYKYTPNEDFDFEAEYADLINFIPPPGSELYTDDDMEDSSILTNVGTASLTGKGEAMVDGNEISDDVSTSAGGNSTGTNQLAPEPTQVPVVVEPTPIVEITPDPTITEEPTPTDKPTPTEGLTPTDGPTPTETPVPTEIPAPTEVPTPGDENPSTSVTPSITPTPSPTGPSVTTPVSSVSS